MRNIRNSIAALFIIVTLSSCARSCQSLERKTFDNKKHKIKITQYSGGQKVGYWEINGIVNSSENSDGYYFYHNNKLVEISGDIKLEYLD